MRLMHYITELAIRIGIIYGGILAGFLLQFLKNSEKLSKWLTFIGLNILTPVLLIFVMLGIDDTSISWGYIVLVGILTCIFSMIIDWLWIRNRLDMTNARKGAEISAVSFMNSLFYPFPIIIGLVGNDGLLAASIFLIVNVILRNSLGVFIGIYFGSTEGKSLWKIMRGMLLFPPSIGLIIGAILRVILGNVVPNNIGVDIFRDVTMFLMLALVGLKFRFPKKQEWKEAAISRGVITRFGGGLLATIPIFFFPLAIPAQVSLIVQSLSPPAVNNTAYANYFNLDGTITSRYITILTLIGLILLPLEILVITYFVL
ncbi:MAG: hypothetical protein K9W46_04575 [Candidatus Heimdallarchaeum endolithica]|uniref:Uncharacterized protein n=1 Tax=Candidatus Heimdallarchaeum endolithica TaxID=2876572 RepID=A0A9Y1FQ68_9ARCH|nr:MAG: hypothetical protein K9W46_04575 [Candidatus Heimdallarchaeum endolithica]